ncbi:MAG: undecaprenyl-diphosphate phosphatase [Alistipes sp.]|jgi:undecaprenyl-diphosphatase|nr:undecaprenyl-diphosphate phosphatase [Alistipes sp.]
MSILEAIILGIVQGLAEFLPVSSSGHLQIAKEALGVTLTDNLTFDISLHVATVLATVVVLWREVGGIFRGLGTGLLRGRRNAETDYAFKLLLSMVPVAVVGLLLRDELNAMLASPAILPIVGSMLLLTAGLLVFAGRAREKESRNGSISWRDSLITGVGQAAAAMPGLSRSGTTIATGLLLGNRRAVVAQFSFLMVIVPILGEALLDVVRGDFSGGTGVGAAPLIAGFAAAFAVGCASCRFMIGMVKRSRLVWFAVYCAVVGVATIIYYFA